MKFANWLALVVVLLLAPQLALAQGTTINGLPAATLPFDCSEVVPIWQGGKTVKANTCRLAADFAGATAPSSPFLYQKWFDTSANPLILKQWDGAQWVQLGSLDTVAHIWTPAGGGGGAVASVYGRTGAVTAQTGDYSVSQVTGAAPLASPTFTGTVTIPNGSSLGTPSSLNASNATNLNGSNIASGTVPTARLPTGKSVADPGTGSLEALMPVQTVTGASKSFATADLQYETRRSNSGSAMADSFPAAAAAGMVNGARITVNNVDASAADTIAAGSGTTISGGNPVPAGRSITFVYDQPNTTWRPTYNTGTAVIGPASATAGNVASYADTTGKKTADSGVAVSDLITNNTNSGCPPGTYGDATHAPVVTFTANGICTGASQVSITPGGGTGGQGVFSGSATGTNTYAITPTQSGFALTDQIMVVFKIPNSNTGASTENVNATGAKPIEVQSSGSIAALVGGEMKAGNQALTQYQAACDCFVLLNPAGSNVVTVTTNKTIDTSDWSAWSYYDVTGNGVTLTTPQVAGLSGRGGLIVYADGHDVTLTPNAADNIDGGTTGASKTLKNSTVSFLSTDQVNTIKAPSLLTGVDLSTATGNLSVNRLNGGSGATSRTVWGGDGAWHDRAAGNPASGSLMVSGGTSGDPTGIAPGSSSNCLKGDFSIGSCSVASGGPAFHPGFATGQYYTAPGVSSETTLLTVSGRLYAHPFYNPNTSSTTMTVATIHHTSGADASAECSAGLYANSSGVPGSKIADFGAKTTGTTSGDNSWTGLSVSVPSGWSWLVVGCNSSGTYPTLTAANASSIGFFTGINGGLNSTTGSLYGTWTYVSGVLPTNFPAVTYNTATSSYPLVGIGP